MISDLAARIRTNINMLFIVAMLSTLAFTMITFLYGFGKFMKFDTVRENPFPFTYLSHTENTLADEHLNWLEQKFNEEHFTYTKFKTDIYEYLQLKITRSSIMPLSKVTIMYLLRL